MVCPDSSGQSRSGGHRRPLIASSMQRLARLSHKLCILEPEDPATFSPGERIVRSYLALSFRGLVAIFFAWHLFDFLFSAIWMHGYVWSLNLPIDLDLSDKSAGSIVYHQKNIVGQNERVFHAFGAVSGTFIMMICSGFASGSNMKVWELAKLGAAVGLLVATVRPCQLKHRLFSALHEGFYTQFLVFFAGIILALRSAQSSPDKTNEEESGESSKEAICNEAKNKIQ